MIGGSSRVPFVQETVEQTGARLSFTLNGDEATVLGATNTKRKIQIKDHFPFDLVAKVPEIANDYVLSNQFMPVDVPLTHLIPKGLQKGMKIGYSEKTVPSGMDPAHAVIVACEFNGVQAQLENWISTLVTVQANLTHVYVAKAYAIVQIVSLFLAQS
jgi:hypothetical protein